MNFDDIIKSRLNTIGLDLQFYELFSSRQKKQEYCKITGNRGFPVQEYELQNEILVMMDLQPSWKPDPHIHALKNLRAKYDRINSEYK